MSTNPAHTEIYTRNPADPAMSCYQLPSYLDKIVGSYRRAGDPVDENAVGLNAYLGLGYTGSEMFTNESMAQVPYAFDSVIVTGGSRWQFFTMEDYRGFSECTNNGEFFIPNFFDRFGVKPAEIKSMHINCTKDASRLNPNHVFTGYNL